MSSRVVPVPCLADNYAYLVICERTGLAAIVDPGEPQPVLDAVRREGVKLAAVWATHHHGDHVGGVEDVIAEVGPLEVVAHERDEARVPKANRIVDDGGHVEVGEVRADIIHNPGHTLGAISFVIDGGVFTGDTMFAAGCGRLFEGTAEMMRISLERLVALPPETRVYFGHEYTHANLRFAAAVEPDNAAVRARAARPAPTTPSTIADERATNPFARCREPAVIDAARAQDPTVEAGDPSAVLAVIRRWKDTFK